MPVRKPFTILGILLSVVIGILLSLMVSSHGPNDYKNGFSRQGLNGPAAIRLHELNIGETLYKICGATPQRFFFTGRDPRRIFSANMAMNRVDSFFIPFPLTRRAMVAYDLKIDSPGISLYANNLSAILGARLDDTTIHTTLLPTRLFTAAIQLSPQSFILKAFDSSGMRQVFKKINTGSNTVIRQAPLIEDNKDAGFSADGMLRYDSASHRLLYAQFYQNRFFCVDTNLNVLYTGKTIDTTNNNPVLTRNIPTRNNQGSVLPSVPLHIINRACVTSGGFIYILSTLKADNETAEAFRNNAAIDVYRIANGAYRGSFYIPDLHGEKAQNLFLANGLLLVYYNRYIGSYTIPVR